MENKHDPFLAQAIAAVSTDRIELGTSMAIAFPRSPMVVANLCWDLQNASRGRFVLGIGPQIALAALMVRTSKGAAGVTGAGLVTLAASLQAFGGEFFSPEAIAVGIALIVGIDRVMSEGRALTNAIGNCVATVVVAAWEGDLDRANALRVLEGDELVDVTAG